MFFNLPLDVQYYLLNNYIIISDLVKLDTSCCNINRNQLIKIYQKISINIVNHFNGELDNNNFNNVHNKLNKWLMIKNISNSSLYIYPEFITNLKFCDYKFVPYIQSKSNMIKVLNIRNVMSLNNDFVFDLINIISSCNKNLHSVSLHNVTDNIFDIILNKCSNITNLTISYNQKNNQNKYIRLMTSKYPNLKTLHLAHHIILLHNVLLKLPELQHLIICDLEPISHIFFKSSLLKIELLQCSDLYLINFDECINLKYLHIKNCPKITQLDLMMCINLKHLHIENCQKIFQLDLTMCINLKHLHFENCQNITNLKLSKCIKLLILHIIDCKYLNYLDISYCINIQSIICNYSIESFKYSNFNNLEYLNFNPIDKYQIREILLKCKNLSKLIIHSFDNKIIYSSNYPKLIYLRTIYSKPFNWYIYNIILFYYLILNFCVKYLKLKPYLQPNKIEIINNSNNKIDFLGNIK